MSKARPIGHDETVSKTMTADHGCTPYGATVALQPNKVGVGSARVISPQRDHDYDDLMPVAPENYVLEEPLAEGGMGRIIRARDRRLGRAVAIKELRIATPDLLVRFRREAQITARLQHPSIVTVHEAGVWPNGEPFFAMEMIAGRPLDEVIEGSTTVLARISLVPHVIAVADALAYAHSRGVIHRDLKPANVLVGEYGETVVIDWGLAREVAASESPRAHLRSAAVDSDAHHTRVGAVLGTPAYMPPEQARGERVDERADVYAIGALLYHVLTGQPPIDGDTTDAILQQVIERGASPLSESAHDVPADLVAIVEKAMARKPADRYPTARELAEDLRRYQTGQLVGAHRYTASERVRRFLRRYRVVLAVMATAALLLATTGTYSIVRILDERDEAVTARADAESQRTIAESRRKSAAAQQAAAEELVAFMLSDLKPGLERAGRLDVMHGVGKEVDAYYSRLTELTDLDPAAIERRAEAVRTLGDVLDASGDVAGARRSYERSLEMLTARSVPSMALAVARVKFNLAIAIAEQGDLPGALGSLEQGRVSLATVEAGPEKDLVSARIDRWVGIIQLDQGQSSEAAASFTSAIEHATAAARAKPSDRAMRMEISKAHDRRFDVRRLQGDRDGALADARASLAIREQLVRDDPQDLPAQYALAISWDKMFHHARSANQPAEAQHAADRQIAIAEALVRHDPTNKDWTRMLLGAAERPSDLAYDRDEFTDAAQKQERVVTLAQQIVDADPTNATALADLGGATSKLGSRLAFAGSSDRALTVLRRALAIYEDLHARFPANTDHVVAIAMVHHSMGDAHASRADAASAADEYRITLATYEERLRQDPENPNLKSSVATTQIETGRALANLATRHRDGLELMQRGLDTLRAMHKAQELSPESEALLPSWELAARHYTYVRGK